MKKLRVGVIGCTGTVGQRFLSILKNHPWFELTYIGASEKSAGKPFFEVVKNPLYPIPSEFQSMQISDVSDLTFLQSKVDFVFCCIQSGMEETKKIEEAIAKHEIPVISTSSAFRTVQDVPMIIPEINPRHARIIPFQRKRLSTKKGFIAVKCNCTLQSFMPVVHPLREAFGLKKMLVCTDQAVSGAGKTLDTMPEIVDNVIPYIQGEEEKTANEPKKIWGKIKNGKIVNADVSVSASCMRVPVSDGHTVRLFLELGATPCIENVKSVLEKFSLSAPSLPSAPKTLFKIFDDPYRPQPKLDRTLYDGMGVSIGRIERDDFFGYRFVCLSHNTLKGAAKGAIELAELLYTQGYLY